MMSVLQVVLCQVQHLKGLHVDEAVRLPDLLAKKGILSSWVRRIHNTHYNIYIYKKRHEA